MQNAEGVNVDLYIPRKCSWTNRILAANDFGAVQINVANIDPATGVYTKTSAAYAISGFVRGHVSFKINLLFFGKSLKNLTNLFCQISAVGRR
jgi:small subunit ribosomal protein S21e